MLLVSNTARFARRFACRSSFEYLVLSEYEREKIKEDEDDFEEKIQMINLDFELGLVLKKATVQVT